MLQIREHRTLMTQMIMITLIKSVKILLNQRYLRSIVFIVSVLLWGPRIACRSSQWYLSSP
jgi:hypothetical protein